MSEPPTAPTGTAFSAFLFGTRTAATSVFAFVIIFTYIGFGALAHDYGFSVGWAMLSTVLQWAGPAQVILVTGLGPGTVLIETAVAVGLSSVRFLPIVVALMPLVKHEDSRPWQLLVPAHFIQRVTATHQGKLVLSAQWGPAVAKNPFLEFNFKGGQKGDKIAVTWEDNKGDTRTDETTIN